MCSSKLWAVPGARPSARTRTTRACSGAVIPPSDAGSACDWSGPSCPANADEAGISGFVQQDLNQSFINGVASALLPVIGTGGKRWVQSCKINVFRAVGADTGASVRTYEARFRTGNVDLKLTGRRALNSLTLQVRAAQGDIATWIGAGNPEDVSCPSA